MFSKQQTGGSRALILAGTGSLPTCRPGNPLQIHIVDTGCAVMLSFIQKCEIYHDYSNLIRIMCLIITQAQSTILFLFDYALVLKVMAKFKVNKGEIHDRGL